MTDLHFTPTEQRTAVGGTPLIRVLRDTLEYSRRRDYTGWDYGDGMSSRILRALPVDNRWINLLFQETIKRSPVNIRPLLLVEQRRNYKGAALFAMANLNFHDLTTDIAYNGAGATERRDPGRASGAGTDGDAGTRPAADRADRAAGQSDGVDYAEEATGLVDWLVEERCRGYSGFCGGHRHEIQHLDQKGVPNDPDVVSTSFAVKALLAATRFDDSYADIARTAVDFVVEDLAYREVEGGAKINYHLNHSDDIYTLNAGALGARLFLDLYARFGEEHLRDRARKILDYLAEKQTDAGGWMYRDPPSSSHLSMDNHHNGFVIESFLRYAEVVGSDRYEPTIEDALDFYRHTLFEPDGAPNWDETSAYPKDVHACAQGILVFTYAGEVGFAERILDWTLENLYAGDGRFYYRKHRLYTKRTTLMRWCQAWMAYAMSEYLVAVRTRTAAPHGEPIP